MMERYTERQRIMAALIWGLALALFYFAVVAPYFSAAREAALAERDGARTLLARTEQYQRMSSADAQAEDKLRLREAHLCTLLPEEQEQGRFLPSVERSARRAGVTLERIVPHRSESTGAVIRQTVEIRLYGGYFAILSFMRDVEAGDRAVSFAAIDLTADGSVLHGTLMMETATLAAGE